MWIQFGHDCSILSIFSRFNLTVLVQSHTDSIRTWPFNPTLPKNYSYLKLHCSHVFKSSKISLLSCIVSHVYLAFLLVFHCFLVCFHSIEHLHVRQCCLKKNNKNAISSATISMRCCRLCQSQRKGEEEANG